MGAGQNPSPPPPPPPPSGGWDGRDWKEWGRNLETDIRRRSEQGDWTWKRRAPHHMFIGMVIIAVGVLLLLENLHIPGIHDLWRFWPVILIVVGLSRIGERPSPAAMIWGCVVAGIGTVFLLHNYGIYIDLGLLWPVAIIGFGLMLLAKNLSR